MTSFEVFDRAYFEDGIRTGKSLYEHYHWMPERSLVEAHWFIEYMGVGLDARVLDFGCAKGFFVKAMHLLGYAKTHGYDTSRYALRNCDPSVRDFLFKDSRMVMEFDYACCKDVLEHCTSTEHLSESLKLLSNCHRVLLIVPNASNGQYIIPEYELDTTHVIRLDEPAWSSIISEHFVIDELTYELQGFKQKWVNEHPQGNLFFQLTAK